MIKVKIDGVKQNLTGREEQIYNAAYNSGVAETTFAVLVVSIGIVCAIAIYIVSQQ